MFPTFLGFASCHMGTGRKNFLLLLQVSGFLFHFVFNFPQKWVLGTAKTWGFDWDVPMLLLGIKARGSG